MPVNTSNIFTDFITCARQNPSKDAVLFSQSVAYRSETYSLILKKSVAYAKGLVSRGIKPGDRVVILLENGPEFPWVVMSIFGCGAVMVPLDIQYPSETISRLVKHSGAKMIISSRKMYQKHHPLVQGEWLCADDAPKILADHGDIDREIESLSQIKDDAAALFYTSGTTSDPKAVVLTHANLLANVNSIRSARLVMEDDVVISILPLHHTYAFTVTFLCPLLTGMTVVYPKSLASADLMACMKQTCTTHFVAVPQVFAMIHRSIKDQIAGLRPGVKACVGLLERVGEGARKWGNINIASRVFNKIHQLFGPSLKVMVSGGAKLDPVIAEDFYRWGFTLVEGYGLTETSPVVSFSIPDRPKFGSVGKPLPGVNIRIDSPDDKGEGEVCVSGPNVMKGYYQMDSETQKVLRDGWFYTGDVGFIDREGFLYLTGRQKEMLVLTNGKNIHPEELEAHYGQNPFIKEIAVLTARDAKKDVDLNRLVAIIVPDEDYFLAQQEMHIRKRLRWELENYSAKLPMYKRIRGFAVAQDMLPRTRLGKLKRFELEDIFLALTEGSAKEPVLKKREQYSEFLSVSLNFIQEQLGRDVSPEDHLELDLGLDSLGRLEIFVALQKRLGVTFSDEESSALFTCATVKQVLDQLKEIEAHHQAQRQMLQVSTEGFSAMAKSALTYLEDQAGRDVSLDDHLELDLGLDSLSRVELLLGIQERLGLSLSEDDAVRFFMCAKVSDLLDELNRVTADTMSYRKAMVDWRDVLFQKPDEESLERISLKPLTLLGKVCNVMILGSLRAFFKIFFQMRVSGIEHLPEKGPYILCANHTTYFDGLFIATAMPFSITTQTFFLGDSKFLDHWMFRPFKKVARLISIQFTHRMVEALKLCSYVLRRDKILCYFPEGQRSIDGEVKEFRKGIGVLVHELDMPVIPIYIRGAFEAWPRGQRWPKPGRVSVHFGEPVSPKDLVFKITEEEDVYQRVSENLRERIIALSSPS